MRTQPSPIFKITFKTFPFHDLHPLVSTRNIISTASFIVTSSRSAFGFWEPLYFNQHISFGLSLKLLQTLCHNGFRLWREMAVPYRTGSETPTSITRPTLPCIHAERGSTSQNYEAKQTGWVVPNRGQHCDTQLVQTGDREAAAPLTLLRYSHTQHTADSPLSVQKDSLFLHHGSNQSCFTIPLALFSHYSDFCARFTHMCLNILPGAFYISLKRMMSIQSLRVIYVEGNDCSYKNILKILLLTMPWRVEYSGLSKPAGTVPAFK